MKDCVVVAERVNRLSVWVSHLHLRPSRGEPGIFGEAGAGEVTVRPANSFRSAKIGVIFEFLQYLMSKIPNKWPIIYQSFLRSSPRLATCPFWGRGESMATVGGARWETGRRRAAFMAEGRKRASFKSTRCLTEEGRGGAGSRGRGRRRKRL